jgi:menaquinone-dependent protoporphyrinogen oxidase
VKVLVTAASRYGATAEIADAIGKTLADRGFDVTILSPEDVAALDDYDAVVLGSAVYTGHWLDAARALVTRCSAGLATRPVWLFSSGPVGDPSRRLVQKMGADPVDIPEIRAATEPRQHRVFAGKLDKRRLTLPQRAALLVFRGMEGDFRDWSAIEAWASEIADTLTPEGRATGS